MYIFVVIHYDLNHKPRAHSTYFYVFQHVKITFLLNPTFNGMLLNSLLKRLCSQGSEFSTLLTACVLILYQCPSPWGGEVRGNRYSIDPIVFKPAAFLISNKAIGCHSETNVKYSNPVSSEAKELNSKGI